ncbi:MFS transporter [Aliirhizobium cellulosilyticum]|uniref:Fucose permease n=1 Tax=Aliirhizobium cellulosilyticum TaxID=393664 RepID=A0A7W6SDG0_9HYPH|nr:MFS transporter [Rhizobium cellulosilyticum]MBB4351715.1 fucose permease [Rhizobium cellulosilyticum]MBB4415029.1 fucose permease [Rhizobium cellulosilyticum]MBB4449641.1 fucose permease [Rhizobium cellulosilyticum]
MFTISQRRLSLYVLFFIPGVAMASWVTRTPAIRDRIGASIAEMGLVLFGLSIGSMLGILLSGALVGRLGTKAVANIGTWMVIAGVATIAFGTWSSAAIAVAVGLGQFGLGMGLAEIAINIDGALVEKQSGKPLMHALHGCFSFGTVCGAIIGLAANTVALPAEWHLLAVAILIAPALVYFIRYIPAGEATTAPETAQHEAASNDRSWRDPRLMAIAVIVLAMALAEGAANDWLPLLMVDEHGFSQVAGSLVFLFFASAMTIGRFTGGFFLSRFGRVAVIRASALLGALGLTLVIFSHHPVLAGLSVLLWGIGASLGFPVAISAAGDSGANATGRVKAVTIGGYIAFLVGPPLLGFVGEHFGLRNAMLVVLALVIAATIAASAVRQPINHETQN